MRKISCLMLLLSTCLALASNATPADSYPTKTLFEAAVSDADRAFMIEAASGGMAEVEMGRLAANKGRSATVKQFGQRMVADHSKANRELVLLAKRKIVALPTELTEQQKQAKDKLSNLTGMDFDREFMRMMVEDHDKDVKAFEDKSRNADDPDLKHFVTKTLPTLKMHQRLAKEIKAKQ